MDAPAMFTRKHVPEDVGHPADDGQGQLHRDEKEHKPVLKKVKDKVRKIKHTLTGHSHGHGHGDEHGRGDDGGGSSDDEEEEGDAALEREAAMEQGGYMDDVEDKTVAMESDPEVHGAPMYESERAPAVQELVAKYDPARAPGTQQAAPGLGFGDLGGTGVQHPFAQEAHGADAFGTRPGGLAGPGVHHPFAQEARGADAFGTHPGGLGAPAAHHPFAQEARGADAFGAHPGGLGAPAAHHPFAQEARSAGAFGTHPGGLAVHHPFAQEAQGTDAFGTRPADLGGPAVHDLAAQGARGADAPGTRYGDLGGTGFHHDTSALGARRDDSPKVRLGDLGGPVVEDPAAPRSRTPAAREGEDIGTTPVVQEFESMTLSDDPAHVGAGKKGARAEEWKDAAADQMGAGATGGATYTDKLKSAAAVPAEYGKKLASTVYEKVAGVGTVVGAGKRDEERTEAVPVSDAPAAVDRSSGPGYTDKIKSTAAGTTEYGKQLASTVYDKVAGVGAAVGAGKRDDGRTEPVPVSAAGGEGWEDAPAAADTADRSSGPGYTDKIKSTAASTTEYGKQLASTVYDKVAGVGTAVAPSLRPQVGAGKPEEEELRNNAMPVSHVGAEERKDATATTDHSASGPGYTEKIKSAAAGTTEYGKQLASTVYEKVAGVGTAVVGKVQQATQSAGTATPGVGAQQDTAGQDKGVTVTGYLAEKLRPADEDRALSEAISGAVQRRKEEVGGTVGQRVPAPSQVITKAREAVTSLTGGNRVSEAVAVQPSTTAGGEDRVAVAAAEEPVLHGEEIGDRKLNTNTM